MWSCSGQLGFEHCTGAARCNDKEGFVGFFSPCLMLLHEKFLHDISDAQPLCCMASLLHVISVLVSVRSAYKPSFHAVHTNHPNIVLRHPPASFAAAAAHQVILNIL